MAFTLQPKTPLLATDAVVFDPQGRVLVIRRRYEPFRGKIALPGGFVEIGETVETACRRELREETGVSVGDLRLVGVYSDPSRDPRGHVVSVAFLTLISGATPEAGDDAADAEWLADWQAADFAFDHARIVADAARLKDTLKGIHRGGHCPSQA